MTVLRDQLSTNNNQPSQTPAPVKPREEMNPLLPPPPPKKCLSPSSASPSHRCSFDLLFSCGVSSCARTNAADFRKAGRERYISRLPGSQSSLTGSVSSFSCVKHHLGWLIQYHGSTFTSLCAPPPAPMHGLPWGMRSCCSCCPSLVTSGITPLRSMRISSVAEVGVGHRQ